MVPAFSVAMPLQGVAGGFEQLLGARVLLSLTRNILPMALFRQKSYLFHLSFFKQKFSPFGREKSTSPVRAKKLGELDFPF